MRTALLACALAASALPPASGEEPSPIVTDRPGFLFSGAVVGDGTLQVELGLPQLALTALPGDDLRSTSLTVALRYGLSPDCELRLGSPLFSRNEVGGEADEGFGDLELGAKWHLADASGARPSLALIPSLLLPAGDDGFSAEEPAYLLNAVAEWGLAGGWGLAVVAGAKLGETPQGAGFAEGTLAAGLGRAFADPRWSGWGEAAIVASDLPGADAAVYLGGGVKWLATPDLQLDAWLDHGVRGPAADWLLGIGLAVRR